MVAKTPTIKIKQKLPENEGVPIIKKENNNNNLIIVKTNNAALYHYS